MKRFSGGFLTSVSLSANDLFCLITNLISNSLKFKLMAFKRCPPLLAIPMIWNHLVALGRRYTRTKTVYTGDSQATCSHSVGNAGRANNQEFSLPISFLELYADH